MLVLGEVPEVKCRHGCQVLALGEVPEVKCRRGRRGLGVPSTLNFSAILVGPRDKKYLPKRTHDSRLTVFTVTNNNFDIAIIFTLSL